MHAILTDGVCQIGQTHANVFIGRTVRLSKFVREMVRSDDDELFSKNWSPDLTIIWAQRAFGKPNAPANGVFLAGQVRVSNGIVAKVEFIWQDFPVNHYIVSQIWLNHKWNDGVVAASVTSGDGGECDAGYPQAVGLSQTRIDLHCRRGGSGQWSVVSCTCPPPVATLSIKNQL